MSGSDPREDGKSTPTASPPLGSRAVVYASSRSTESPEVRRAVDLAVRLGAPSEEVRIASSPEAVAGEESPPEIAILLDRSPDLLLQARRSSPAVWVLAASPRPRERLLVAVDDEETSPRRAIDRQAVSIARVLARYLGLELHGFTSWEPLLLPSYLPSSQHGATHAAFQHRATRRSRRTAQALKIPEDRWHVKEGSFAQSLAEAATEIDPYVIVLGSLGRRGVTRLLLGSRVEKVVEAAREHHVLAVR